MYNFNGKKGLESYIIIILLFSVIITFFIMITVGKIYGEEHIDCKYIEFEINNACKNVNAVSFTINNIGEKIVNLEINKIKSKEYVIPINTDKLIFFGTKDETLVSIVPYLNYSNKIYMCFGKTQKINSEVLIKC